MRVRVLGDLTVLDDDDVAVDLGGRKPRMILGLLVAAEGRAVTVEHLIDQVWGEDPPGRVEATLQSYVARLRRALEPDRAAGAAPRLLRTHAGGYSFGVDAGSVDARVFARSLREARRAPDDEAEPLLVAALDLWHGEAYGGLGCPALDAEATRLAELRMTALADLWELRLRRGEHAAAVPELEHLVRLHPLRERLWALLALALYRDARQGDALAALRRARDHLAESLGVDPGVELRDLEAAILRQEVEPVPAAPPPAGVPVAEVADKAARAEPTSAPPEPAGSVLVGRDDAVARADQALTAAVEGHGRVVLVSGEPGIGKTRLADAVVARAAERGFRTGRGTWEEETCPPLWGWRSALEQAVGSAGALDDAAATGADSATILFQQGDAVLAELRGATPTVLMLDDLQWADLASLRLLRRVGAGLASAPAVVVVTVREAPAEISDDVAETLGALARTDPLRLDLAGLGVADVARWAAGHAGRPVSDRVAAELAVRTDGNPFYLAELVRLLVTAGALTDPEGDAWAAVPTGVRDVVRQRLSRMPAESVDVLQTCAVVGRTFDLAVVSAVHDGDVDTVAAVVEDAQVRGMLDHEGPDRARFTHALVRDAVYATASAPARSRRHGAVAAALEAVHAGRVEEHAPELAEHYRQAGPAHVRSAWVFARRAAARAATTGAHDEAQRWYGRAASLQDADPTVTPAEREEVLVGHARQLVVTGRPVDAWAPAARAARSALDRGDGLAAARALLTVTERMVWGWRTHPWFDDDAIALWEEVLAAGPHEELVAARITAALAVERFQRPGDEEESTRLADRAVAAVRRRGRHDTAELEVLRVAQGGLLRPDLLFHRLPLADEIVERASRWGSPLDVASALTARAADRAELGRLDDAHSDVLRARGIAEHHGFPQNLMITRWCRAVRLLLDEDDDAAEQLIAETETFQHTIAMSGYGIGTFQLAMLRELQGRLRETEPELRPVRAFHPGLREIHALALARTGELDRLRLELGAWAEQPPLSRDYMWMLMTALRAETWSVLGDREAAADLYEQLLPFADRLAISVPIGFFGAVEHSLGRLAQVLDRHDLARAHLERARQVHADHGLGRWVRRTEHVLGTLAPT